MGGSGNPCLVSWVPFEGWLLPWFRNPRRPILEASALPPPSHRSPACRWTLSGRSPKQPDVSGETHLGPSNRAGAKPRKQGRERAQNGGKPLFMVISLLIFHFSFHFSISFILHSFFYFIIHFSCFIFHFIFIH